jgi:hypothetical protein
MMTSIQIGRLLRAGNSGFVAGCRVSQEQIPAFGVLVQVPLESGMNIYGLVYDIHIDDDGLVRQLVTAGEIQEAVIADNRLNRNVPLEVSVLAVGYRQAERIYHLLPPRPPLSLDSIYLCSDEEIRSFTPAGRFGYLRHILRLRDLPVDELLAAHLLQAAQAHRQFGELDWVERATQELVTLLRDDYPTLMSVLGALKDTRLFETDVQVK